MGRLVLAALAAVVLLTPSIASAADPAELLSAYAERRDAIVADAATRIEAAGPGTADAREAAFDARAQLTGLADALAAATGSASGPVAETIDARLAADGVAADALASRAAGRLGRPGLTRALERAEAGYRDRAGAAAAAGERAGRGMDPMEIAQSVAGPALLIGTLALVTWRTARRRRAAAAG